MFFLKAYSKNGGLIILHVRGYNNKTGFGLIEGEGIFEVKPTDRGTMHVTRQVGVVQLTEDHLTFNYTDPDFKKLIDYKEESGYSSLDGGLWEVRRTRYLDKEGKTQHDVNPNTLIHFIYTSAKNPFMKQLHFATLFSQAGTRNENNQETIPQQKPKRFRCAIQ